MIEEIKYEIYIFSFVVGGWMDGWKTGFIIKYVITVGLQNYLKLLNAKQGVTLLYVVSAC